VSHRTQLLPAQSCHPSRSFPHILEIQNIRIKSPKKKIRRRTVPGIYAAQTRTRVPSKAHLSSLPVFRDINRNLKPVINIDIFRGIFRHVKLDVHTNRQKGKAIYFQGIPMG
jgi:hypothetical protein